MKISALVLSLVALAPTAAVAQMAPGSPPPNHAMHGGMMRGDMHDMMKAHEAFRRQVLAALTPAHRQLLATVVGQLAVSDKPDHKAAAAKLDAALSSNEKQAILAAHAQMMTQMEAQMKAQHEKMMQAWQSAHPNATPWPKHSPHGEHGPRTPDPGMILLMVAGGHDMPMMMDGHHPRRR